MPFYYYDWTMILVIPGLLLGLYAQFKVKSTFDRYSRVRTRSGLTAEQAARMLLSRGGSANVTISRVNGSLTDHYDPRSNTLRLSDSVYGSDSVAAVGVAAHECGHALQEHDGYGLLSCARRWCRWSTSAAACICPSLWRDFCSAGNLCRR